VSTLAAEKMSRAGACKNPVLAGHIARILRDACCARSSG
jgi:hypothetical protein